jgi:hypothetical protein
MAATRLVGALALSVAGLCAALPTVTTPSVAATFATGETSSAQRYALRLLSLTQSSWKDPVTGLPVETSVEFLVYSEDLRKIYVVNTPRKTLDVFSLNVDGSVTELGRVDTVAEPNSVYYNKRDKVIAVAVQGAVGNQDAGTLMFLDADTLASIKNVSTATPMPDHVSFGPGDSCAYSANEAESPKTAATDKAGGVTQVCASNFKDASTYTVADSNLGNLAQSTVDALQASTSGAHKWASDRDFRVQIEPEYITYGTPDSNGFYEVYVGCQEVNLMLVYRGNTAGTLALTDEPVRIMPLGFKDAGLSGNGFDPVNDNVINTTGNTNVKMMYQPDTILKVRYNERDYIVTANEGDKAENGETTKAGSTLTGVTLAANLQLMKFSANGLSAGWDAAYQFGGRSFSLIDALTGAVAFDSGDQFERMLAKYAPTFFNTEKGLNWGTPGGGEVRSDSKGPEPESLAFGTVNGKDLLFVGLERPGLIMVYDMTNPLKPEFMSINGACSLVDNCAKSLMVDPESLVFVPAAKSPTGKPLLIASGSVSGTVQVFEVFAKTVESDAGLTVTTRALSAGPTTQPSNVPTKAPSAAPVVLTTAKPTTVPTTRQTIIATKGSGGKAATPAVLFSAAALALAALAR